MVIAGRISANFNEASYLICVGSVCVFVCVFVCVCVCVCGGGVKVSERCERTWSLCFMVLSDES